MRENQTNQEYKQSKTKIEPFLRMYVLIEK